MNAKEIKPQRKTMRGSHCLAHILLIVSVGLPGFADENNDEPLVRTFALGGAEDLESGGGKSRRVNNRR